MALVRCHLDKEQGNVTQEAPCLVIDSEGKTEDVAENQEDLQPPKELRWGHQTPTMSRKDTN